MVLLLLLLLQGRADGRNWRRAAREWCRPVTTAVRAVRVVVMMMVVMVVVVMGRGGVPRGALLAPTHFPVGDCLCHGVHPVVDEAVAATVGGKH